MHPESERERRALKTRELAERIHERATNDRWSSLCAGGSANLPGTQVYWLNLAHIALEEIELAALRQTTAEPDTAGREAGAAEMRERCILAIGASLDQWKPHIDGGSPVAPEEAEGAVVALRAVRAAIRSLPLHPEGSERTMGGDDGR